MIKKKSANDPEDGEDLPMGRAQKIALATNSKILLKK